MKWRDEIQAWKESTQIGHMLTIGETLQPISNGGSHLGELVNEYGGLVRIFHAVVCVQQVVLQLGITTADPILETCVDKIGGSV